MRLKLKEDGVFDWSPFDAIASRCTSIPEPSPKGIENSNIKVY
jgi:hypothetical protein